MKHRAPARPSRLGSLLRCWRGGEPATIRILIRAAGWLATAALIMLCLPAQLGGSAGYTVVAGHSMNPGYRTGDLVITCKQDRYRVGQVVVYRVPPNQPGAGYLVVHRLVGGSNLTGWVSKGDNNAQPDIWTPRNADIQGTALTHLPKVGYLLHQARNPLVYCLLGGLTVGKLLWPGKGTQPTGTAGSRDTASAMAASSSS